MKKQEYNKNHANIFSLGEGMNDFSSSILIMDDNVSFVNYLTTICNKIFL